MRRLLPALALLALAATVVAFQSAAEWEARYGPIARVSVDDLIRDDFAYDDRGVTTFGRLEPGMGVGEPYRLRGTLGGFIAVVPLDTIAYEFDQDARVMTGKQVEVTGVFQSVAGSRRLDQPSGLLRIWEYQPPQREPTPDELKGATTSLEDLVTRTGGYDGRTVRVVGQFRGRNLFGDLPSDSQRRREDWVIKHDLFAVWIVGREPKGDGFELDPEKRRDTNRWVEVIGEVETARGVTYVRASKISLSRPPTPEARAAATPTPTPRPRKPPVIVFTLPLDGEVVPTTTVFTIQFSKDMIVESFDGRVVVRYAGPTLPGDRPFDGVLLGYDGGRRALTVDPGDVLRPGRVLEIWLLAGIEDIEGMTLVPRVPVQDAPPGLDVADILRYRVGG